MEGVLSLLLFAAVFYVMMRFGCGAHMVHGHAGHGDHKPEADSASARAATDPVCGMTVSGDQGYTKMHDGRQYRFCSKVCLDKFESNPQIYAAGGVR